MAVGPEELSKSAQDQETESARLAALARFDFVDPEPGDILNRFARLAAQVFDTPIGVLSFVESEVVRFVARHGLELTETPLRRSFFAQAIVQDDVVWIGDAREIEPFRHAPLVASPPMSASSPPPRSRRLTAKRSARFA